MESILAVVVLGMTFFIFLKGPRLVYRLVTGIYYLIRFKTMYHYIEYEYFGNRYTTRRSGPLNDLEGNGLLCEIKRRRGSILVHKTGSHDQIVEIIQWHREHHAAKHSRTFNQY